MEPLTLHDVQAAVEAALRKERERRKAEREAEREDREAEQEEALYRSWNGYDI